MRSDITDGQLLWRGLSAAPTEPLASNLALLEETRFFGVLSKKAKSVWKREGDEFARQLQARTAELNKLPREVLLLRLLGKLREMSDLSATHYVAQRDLVDACQQICARAIEYQRSSDKDFSGQTLQEMISYQLQKIMGTLKDKFDDLAADKQDEIVDKLKDYLNSLPEEQQQEIRKRLDAEELTAEVVRNAIVTGSLGVAFAALVNMLGFSFYMGAVSALAAVAALAGLTLPFAAYTTLTSAIAVLVDPITITASLLLLLTFGWWRSDKTLRETLLPVAVVQLAGAQGDGAEPVADDISWRVLVAWQDAVSKVVETRQQLEQRREQRKQLVSERKQLLAALKTCEADVKGQKKLLAAGWSAVHGLVADRCEQMAAGDWGDELKERGRLVQTMQREQSVQADANKSESWRDAVRDSAKGKWSAIRSDWKAMSAADEITAVLQTRDDFAGISDPVLLDKLLHIQAIRSGLAAAEVTSKAAGEKVAAARERIAEQDRQITAAIESVAAAEGAYPGLSEAASLPVASLPVRIEAPPPVSPKVQAYLWQPLVREQEEDRLRRMLSGGQGDMAFAGLTVGDFLYDYVRMDPTVIEAADFARAADLGDPLSFAAFAVEQSALEGAAELGMVNQVQGYVAERLVAQHMSAAGYDVSFPKDSNQPGWDVLIDGERFQVKCGTSAELVRNHFDKYPDIPVIVNRELGEAFGEHPGVYVDQELSVEHVREMTEAGLAQGEELADFELPLLALTVSAAIEARALLRGEGALDAAIINVLTNTGGRVAGGMAGQTAGSLIGVVLFGPAGGIIGGLVGTVGGGIGGGALARSARRILAGEEADAVRAAAQNLAAKAAALMPRKREVWAAKQAKIASPSLPPDSDGRELQGYLTWRMRDQDRYFEKCGKELALLGDEMPDRAPVDIAQRVLGLVKRAALHPHLLQQELKELFDAVKAYIEKLANYRAAG